MKCKACDGKGTYITIGIDKAEFVDKEEKCPVCNGTGEVEQTNEEWFCLLSTKEKAKTIICLAVNSMYKQRKGLVDSDIEEIIRWLKAVHK